MKAEPQKEHAWLQKLVGEWMFEGDVLGQPRRWSRRRAFFVDPRDGILKDWSELPGEIAAGCDGKGGAT